jgi:tRNA (adenine37-N6)-methyltransferase
MECGDENPFHLYFYSDFLTLFIISIPPEMRYKSRMEICYKTIGVMHCELDDPDTAPKFYTESNISGIIEIFEPFAEGLTGLENFGHIVVLFHFHKSQGFSLMQRRRGEGELRGVFSLCSPMRPNAIGMSILKLRKIEDAKLYVENVDFLNGTPILDIKPYKPWDYPTETQD